MNPLKILLIFLVISPLALTLGCQTCIQIVQALQGLTIKLAPQSLVQEAVNLVCQRKYDSEQLCDKITKEITPLAIQSGTLGLLKEGRICETFCPSDFYQTFDLNNVEESLNNVLTEQIKEWRPTYEVMNLSKTSQSKNIRVLHITDVHLDLNYTQKASTVCNMPICCHTSNGFPQTQSVQAKPLGSVKCDTPIKLFDMALDYIEQNLNDIDIVVITGDNSAHNEWQKTPQTVLSVRKLVQDKIKQKSHTVNLITAPGNNQYLPDHQVDPTSVQEESIKIYKVYQSDEKYVTFISMNTLFCDNQNLYLIQDQTSSIRQLKMLEKVLAQNQNVYIVGHIGLSSSSCSSTYIKIFRTIINKYKDNILGQFYGHTHLDQFIVNTNPKDSEEPSSVSFLTGSLSPLGTGASRFRMYELSSENMKISNYFDYELKMNEQIKGYGLNYEFKQFYEIDSQFVTPQIMQNLQMSMKSSQELRKKYSGQLNGRSSGTNQHAYCQTFDDPIKIQQCLNNELTFNMKVNEVLQMLQGQWGSYGQIVQASQKQTSIK